MGLLHVDGDTVNCRQFAEARGNVNEWVFAHRERTAPLCLDLN